MTLRPFIVGALLALAVMLGLSCAHASTLAPVLSAAPTLDHVFTPTVVERVVVKEIAAPAPVVVAPAAVSIPWGEWLQREVFPNLWIAFSAVVLWGLRKAPLWVRTVIGIYGEDRAMRELHDMIANLVKGVSKDGSAKYDLSVGSEYVAMGLRLAVDKFPDLVRSVGGLEAMRDKLIARLDLHPEESAAPLLKAA